MHRVKDSQGREWDLALNLGLQLKLKSLFKIDIRQPSIFEQLIDPEVFANIVGCILEPQLASKGISRDQLFESLGVEEIDALASALIEEISDFFPERQRPIVKALLAKGTTHQKAMADLAMAKANSPEMDQLMTNSLKQADQEIDKAMTDANQKLTQLMTGKPIGNSSGSVLESPA